VTTVSGDRSIVASPTTGAVTVGVSAPTVSNGVASSAISTTETIINAGPYKVRSAYGEETYRITVYGTCNSTSGGCFPNTNTFNIRYGPNNSLADTLIYYNTFNAATSGTDVPFKLELLLTWNMTSGVQFKVCGNVLNNGTTGISANAVTIFTPTLTSVISDTGEVYMNITYQSSNSGTNCTFHDVVMETVR
jgi:hypothetical protein